MVFCVAFAGGGGPFHQLVEIDVRYSQRQQSDGSEYTEAAPYVVGHYEGFVALPVGEGF